MRFLQKARGILFLRLAFLFFLWYTECGTKFYNAHESGDERAFRISFFRFHGNFVPTTEIPMQRVSFGGTLYFLQGGNTNGRKDRLGRRGGCDGGRHRSGIEATRRRVLFWERASSRGRRFAIRSPTAGSSALRRGRSVDLRAGVCSTASARFVFCLTDKENCRFRKRSCENKTTPSVLPSARAPSGKPAPSGGRLK